MLIKLNKSGRLTPNKLDMGRLVINKITQVKSLKRKKSEPKNIYNSLKFTNTTISNAQQNDTSFYESDDETLFVRAKLTKKNHN